MPHAAAWRKTSRRRCRRWRRSQNRRRVALVSRLSAHAFISRCAWRTRCWCRPAWAARGVWGCRRGSTLRTSAQVGEQSCHHIGASSGDSRRQVEHTHGIEQSFGHSAHPWHFIGVRGYRDYTGATIGRGFARRAGRPVPGRTSIGVKIGTRSRTKLIAITGGAGGSDWPQRPRCCLGPKVAIR